MILLAIVSRLLIGGLFLAGGAAKLAAGDSFRRRWLDSYFKLPSGLGGPVAATFGVLEIAVGSAYVLGVGNSASGWAAAGLLSAVTGVVAVTLIRGRRPACGCGGTLTNSLVSWRLVVRNIAFIAVAAVLASVNAVGPGLGSAAPILAFAVWALVGVAAVSMVGSLARSRSIDEPSVGAQTGRQLQLQHPEI
jgi:hypothetical protein